MTPGYGPPFRAWAVYARAAGRAYAFSEDVTAQADKIAAEEIGHPGLREMSVRELRHLAAEWRARALDYDTRARALYTRTPQ